MERDHNACDEIWYFVAQALEGINSPGKISGVGKQVCGKRQGM
jgi:hypothetical protein